MSDLTPAQLAVLEAPCATCGHGIDDHGGVIPCWLCEDEGRDPACDRNFMALLAERVAVMLAEAWDEGYALDWTGGMKHVNPYRGGPRA